MVADKRMFQWSKGSLSLQFEICRREDTPSVQFQNFSRCQEFLNSLVITVCNRCNIKTLKSTSILESWSPGRCWLLRSGRMEGCLTSYRAIHPPPWSTAPTLHLFGQRTYTSFSVSVSRWPTKTYVISAKRASLLAACRVMSYYHVIPLSYHKMFLVY